MRALDMVLGPRGDHLELSQIVLKSLHMQVQEQRLAHPEDSPEWLALLELESGLMMVCDVTDPDHRPAITCVKCGAGPLKCSWMCDQTEGSFCPKCFAKSPCGKGRHGEGCPTMVMEGEDS